MNSVPIRSARHDVADSFNAIQDYYEEQGWTDGLPVVQATEDAVRGDAGHLRRGPVTFPGSNPTAKCPGDPGKNSHKRGDGRMPPRALSSSGGGGTGHHAARLQPWRAARATTGGAAPVIIVNGPIAEQLGINGDSGCFGPGYRANAVIGRALRLVVRNVAGLIPGEMDKATLALPGRFTFCFSRERVPQSVGTAPRGEGARPRREAMVTITAIRAMYPIMETTVERGEGGAEYPGAGYPGRRGSPITTRSAPGRR